MSDTPTKTITLSTVLDTHAEGLLKGVRVALPGKITAYDPATQLASAQPLIMDAHIDEDEQRIAQALPEVHGCPVMFCGPARGRITWPVAVGDTCEIWYQSSAVGRWVAKGGLVDPGDDRHHDLSDAVVMVGLHDAAHVPTPAPTDAVVIHAGDGVEVRLGGPGASESAVLGDAYRSAEDTLLTALGTFATAIAAFDPLTSAATAATLNTAITAFKTAAASYLSSKVKLL